MIVTRLLFYLATLPSHDAKHADRLLRLSVQYRWLAAKTAPIILIRVVVVVVTHAVDVCHTSFLAH